MRCSVHSDQIGLLDPTELLSSQHSACHWLCFTSCPYFATLSNCGLSYREQKTNEYVWQQVSILAGRQELLLSTVKRRKLSWFGHMSVVMIHWRRLYVPKRTVDGSRRRGIPHKSWKNIIKEWTGQSMSSLLRIADERSMGSHRGGCICRSAPTTSGRHGCSLVSCVPRQKLAFANSFQSI